MAKVWYFAYGSNMSEIQMNQRGLFSSRREEAVLPDYKFVFNKRSQNSPTESFANIASSPGDSVFEWLTELNMDSVQVLDMFEGYPRHYNRSFIEVFVDGTPHSALVYTAMPEWISESLFPSKTYSKKILDNLPPSCSEDYWNSVLRRSIGNK
jgi:hypothetical protein